MAVLNYTTTIPAWRTVAEVEHILMEHGATAVIKQFEDGHVVGLTFGVLVNGQQLPIKLPVRIPKVLEAMKRDKKAHPKKQMTLTMEQAEKVAWRQIKDWVEVQMQMVELEQMTMTQVFLQGVQNRNGITIYEQLESSGYLLPGAYETGMEENDE